MKQLIEFTKSLVWPLIYFVVHILSDKNPDNIFYFKIIHFLKSIVPELVILYFFWLLFVFKTNVIGFYHWFKLTLASSFVKNSEQDLKNKYGNRLIFLIGLSILLTILLHADFFSLLRARCQYYASIQDSFRKDLIARGDFYLANHQLSKAKYYYSSVIDEFPNSGVKKFERKIEEIEAKIEYSRSFYKLAKIDNSLDQFYREQIRLLATSIIINPEDDEIIDLFENKLKLVESKLELVNDFFDSIEKKDKSAIVSFMDKHSWIVFEKETVKEFQRQNGIWEVDKIINFIYSFERYGFKEYVANLWNINSGFDLVKWARAAKNRSEGKEL